MRTATLDLLDAQLTKDFQYHMSLASVAHYKIYKRDVVISPKYWDKHLPQVTAHSFNWVTVKYKDLPAHLDTITSDAIGIYYFSVRPNTTLNNLPHFVFYVGISGQHDSKRPLRDRLRDYLNFEKIKKRDAVHTNLGLYYPTVWVTYSFLSLGGKALSDLETALHGFFMPWAGERDFPVAIKKAQKAWR